MLKRKKNMPLIVGSMIVGGFLLIALFAPILAPCDPHEMGIPYIKPCAEHLLGTNDVGQDIFSELLYGTRVSLMIGVFTAVIVMVVATGMALLSGYYGGIIDKVVTAVTNITMALPSLALTVLLVAYLNPGKLSIIIAISLGMGDAVIMIKHIVPNLKDLILTRAALAISSAMMTEAGLSFLGLGDYGEKSWGSILHYAFYQNGVIRNYYWWYLPPILCTSLATLGFMLMGYYGMQRRRKTC